jgi:3-hydroxyisobutyrate dehydrogenase-like beta-hydroxyacid dehydrogenase
MGSFLCSQIIGFLFSLRGLRDSVAECEFAMNVGILHPGEMGVSVGASAKHSGQNVYWASEGRGPETHARADRADLIELETLAELCSQSDVIISVCPPHAAENVLQDVINTGYSGIYVDANAISPQKSRGMAAIAIEADVDYVDGSIVGRPAWEPNTTFLFLSGEDAETIAKLFHAGPLETRLLGDQIGRASALKMCFAAYSKGSTALISAILAAAQTLGVQGELMQLWGHDDSDFAKEAVGRARRVTHKAWRFSGEMDEIANTFAEIDLPDGFYRASRQIYQRMSHFKGHNGLPELDEVVGALVNPEA